MNVLAQPIFNNIFSIQGRAGTGVRSWFSFKAPTVENKTAEIAIDDEIGGWGISARRLVDQIKSLNKKDTIKVHIYSPGGDVLEANEIYNALAEHEGEVHIHIGALCASAATIIACVGTKVEMAENGLFMIHNPWTIGYGDSEEFRRVADILSKFKSNILGAYTKRTGMTDAALSKLMDEETWLTAEEAVENKFVDNIITLPDKEEEPVQDRFDLSRYKNSASALSRLPKNVGTETSRAGGNTRPSVTTKNQTTTKPNPPASQPRKGNTLLQSYMKNNVRVFAALAGSIAALIPPLSNITASGQRLRVKNGPDDPPEETDEVKNKAIAVEAKKLYTAKLGRDKEIDDIVIAVRTRDKKDFAELAKDFKTSDKTPDEFARAITTSDRFKNIGADNPVGSGVEVLGVQGLPQGTPGELFVSSEEYKALIDQIRSSGKRNHSLAIQTRGFMATAMQNFMNVATSGGLTSIEKLPGVVTLGVRPLMVKDLIAPGATNSTTIRYIQEQSFAIGADTVAEGATKPAAVFALEEIDATVRKIAAYTKVTDELFMDFLAVASYINQRLPYMVERVEEDQLLNGDGTGNNLKGIMNHTGVQAQAKAGDSAHDAIYKAFTKIRWGNLAGVAQGGFEPDGTIIHPTDWEAIRLTKDANGQYYGGGPFTGAYGNGMPVQFEMLWGKPCVITPAIAQGTALTGAFRLASQYFQRQGLTIQSTNTDQDDFIKNLTTIRAEVRLALAVYRPQAFCKITGL